MSLRISVYSLTSLGIPEAHGSSAPQGSLTDFCALENTE